MEQPFRPGDAVAALLVTPDQRYLLQHRDDIEGIFFPGFIGNFGGAIELGEAPIDALRREIREELAFEIRDCEFFCSMTFDFRFAGIGEIVRHFFVVPIGEADVATMRLHEGQGMKMLSGGEILEMAKIVPYDAVAIWQHLMRNSFAGRYVKTRP